MNSPEIVTFVIREVRIVTLDRISNRTQLGQ
jgi:hypothetical protein